MEQKQLDEVEQPLFGEEFIDEEDFEQKKPKSRKNASRKRFSEIEEELKADDMQPSSAPTSVSVSAARADLSKAEVKTESRKEPIKTTAPVDPWKDDKDESHLNPGGSGIWKFIAAMAILLFILSIFTQGFGYGQSKGQVPQAEAQAKMLQFINTYLLEDPFIAEVEKSSDIGAVYMFTLSVAGQSIDSYVSKDGKLFFPRGFSLDNQSVPLFPLPGQLNESASSAANISTDHGSEPTDSRPAGQTPLSRASAPETADATSITISAKKWSFNPQVIKVQEGATVRITIVPDTSNPAFSLSEFTFSLPDFNIEKRVAGTTTVEFVADKKGTHLFRCKGCEEWRGMQGQLVVE